MQSNADQERDDDGGRLVGDASDRPEPLTDEPLGETRHEGDAGRESDAGSQVAHARDHAWLCSRRRCWLDHAKTMSRSILEGKRNNPVALSIFTRAGVMPSPA